MQLAEALHASGSHFPTFFETPEVLVPPTGVLDISQEKGTIIVGKDWPTSVLSVSVRLDINRSSVLLKAPGCLDLDVPINAYRFKIVDRVRGSSSVFGFASVRIHQDGASYIVTCGQFKEQVHMFSFIPSSGILVARNLKTARVIFMSISVHQTMRMEAKPTETMQSLLCV